MSTVSMKSIIPCTWPFRLALCQACGLKEIGRLSRVRTELLFLGFIFKPGIGFSGFFFGMLIHAAPGTGRGADAIRRRLQAIVRLRPCQPEVPDRLSY